MSVSKIDFMQQKLVASIFYFFPHKSLSLLLEQHLLKLVYIINLEYLMTVFST